MLQMTQLLIDGDLFLYKACAASEFEQNWGEGVWVLSTNIEKAKDTFRSIMEGIVRALDSDDVAIVFSGDEDFRRSLDPAYKGNRQGTRKPLGYLQLKEWLATEEYPGRVFSKPTLEADDYLGILATTPGSVERIIVSDDKDMLTIPGKLYRLGQLTEQSEDDADRYWMLQTLTGDPTDGYKGCPGIGKVRAEAIISKPGDRWVNVTRAFLKAGYTENDALLQARLARILRFGDWDAKSQRVLLWTPDNSPIGEAHGQTA